jgi:hypothetical protein
MQGRQFGLMHAALSLVSHFQWPIISLVRVLRPSLCVPAAIILCLLFTCWLFRHIIEMCQQRTPNLISQPRLASSRILSSFLLCRARWPIKAELSTEYPTIY